MTVSAPSAVPAVNLVEMFRGSVNGQEPALKLRGYQQKAVRDVISKYRQQARRVMLQLPTGAGKTVVAMSILKELESGLPAAWITHRRELEEQTGVRGASSGLRFVQMRKQSASLRTLEPGVVTLISPQARKRPPIPASCGLLVVDEAHHSVAATWASWIEGWTGLVLGLTATPVRTNKKDGFDHLYDQLVCGPQVYDLVKEGWLAQPLIIRPDLGALVRLDNLQKARGDYTARTSEMEVLRLMETGLAVDEYIKLSKENRVFDKPALWFTPTKQAAVGTVEVLTAAGLDAAVLLESTPKLERRRVLDGFRSGAPRHVVSVDILGEGLDVPDCRAVVMLRPTLSLSKYLQMVGRGTRPKPDGGPVYVFDFAANYYQHGLPDARRKWDLRAE